MVNKVNSLILYLNRNSDPIVKENLIKSIIPHYNPNSNQYLRGSIDKIFEIIGKNKNEILNTKLDPQIIQKALLEIHNKEIKEKRALLSAQKFSKEDNSITEENIKEIEKIIPILINKICYLITTYYKN